MWNASPGETGALRWKYTTGKHELFEPDRGERIGDVAGSDDSKVYYFTPQGVGGSKAKASACGGAKKNRRRANARVYGLSGVRGRRKAG